MIHRSTGGSWAPGGITASNFINNGMNIGGDALSSVPTQLLSISGWGPTDLFSLAFAGQLAQNDVVNNGTNAFTLTLDSADYAAFNAVPSFDIMWGFAGTVSGSFVRGADVGSVAIVPEPSSALLGGIGMLALMLRRRAV